MRNITNTVEQQLSASLGNDNNGSGKYPAPNSPAESVEQIERTESEVMFAEIEVAAAAEIERGRRKFCMR